MNTCQRFTARDTFSRAGAHDGERLATFTGTVFRKTKRHPG
ncbi:MAG: hypothetical protein P1P74_04385 [Desulfuromonadales bacterium]|nr:hypothetical protein [Desulfuromonadales bacterium]